MKILALELFVDFKTMGHSFCHGFLFLHLVQYILTSSSTKLMSDKVLILPVNHGKWFFILLVVP